MRDGLFFLLERAPCLEQSLVPPIANSFANARATSSGTSTCRIIHNLYIVATNRCVALALLLPFISIHHSRTQKSAKRRSPAGILYHALKIALGTIGTISLRRRQRIVELVGMVPVFDDHGELAG